MSNIIWSVLNGGGSALSWGYSAIRDGLSTGTGPCDHYAINPKRYICLMGQAGPKIAGFVSDQIVQITTDTFLKLGEAVNQGKIKIDPSKLFQGLGDSLNKSGTGLLDGLNIPGLFDRVFQDVGDVSSKLRAVWYKEMDGLVKDIQNLFGSMARGTVFRVLPWVALGTAITVGTPLLVKYLYHKAIYNIGRPQLASEVRKTGLFHKVAGKVYAVTKFAFKKAIHVAAFTGAVVLAGTYLESLGYYLAGDATNFPHTLFSPQKAQDTAVKITAIGAASFLAFDTLKATCKALFGKKPFKTEVFFDPKITQKVGDIADATCNLRKNGGFFQNVLFYGPGGTGKTELAMKIAERSNMNFIKISGGDLAKYIGLGTHVTVVNELFDKITEPTIIFIDEFENLAMNRENIDRSQLHEILNAFLSRTGTPSKKFMVIGATNLKEMIDPAVQSRMDHKIYVAAPAAEERQKILAMYSTQFFPNSKERDLYFNKDVMTRLVYQAEGLTGRALFKLFNMLAQKKHSMKKGAFTSQVIQECVDSFVDQEVSQLPKLDRLTRLVKLYVFYPFELLKDFINQTRERLKKPEEPPKSLPWHTRTIKWLTGPKVLAAGVAT